MATVVDFVVGRFVLDAEGRLVPATRPEFAVGAAGPGVSEEAAQAAARAAAQPDTGAVAAGGSRCRDSHFNGGSSGSAATAISTAAAVAVQLTWAWRGASGVVTEEGVEACRRAEVGVAAAPAAARPRAARTVGGARDVRPPGAQFFGVARGAAIIATRERPSPNGAGSVRASGLGFV